MKKQQGARGFASAWPVARIDILAGIEAVVTRRPWMTGSPEQSFSVTDAATGYSVEGAYAEFTKNKKGVFKDGYLGDAVVLSGDIETNPHEELKHSGLLSPCVAKSNV